jgi:hypothetical protein
VKRWGIPFPSERAVMGLAPYPRKPTGLNPIDKKVKEVGTKAFQNLGFSGFRIFWILDLYAEEF